MFLLRNANTNKKSDNFEETQYVKMTAGFSQTATVPQNGRQQSVIGKILR